MGQDVRVGVRYSAFEAQVPGPALLFCLQVFVIARIVDCLLLLQNDAEFPMSTGNLMQKKSGQDYSCPECMNALFSDEGLAGYIIGPRRQ